MDTPTISRSGRLIKKSAKAIEMEGLDITDLETQDNKSQKKFKRNEEFDNKDIQPIKIPKIFQSNSSPASTSYLVSPKQKTLHGMHSRSKIPPSPVKTKLDPNYPLFQEPSLENSKDFDSSSMSSESSSSSETEYNMKNRRLKMPIKPKISLNPQKMPILQEKVIVEPCKQQFNSPLTFIDQNTDLTMDAREDETNESDLVIAEETMNSMSVKQKGRKGRVAKRKPAKKPIAKLVRGPKLNVHRKYPLPTKDGEVNEAITAYGLWFSEKRKQIVAKNSVSFSSFSMKMAEIWKALPKKERRAWRRKATEMSQKHLELISPEHTVQPPEAVDSVISEGVFITEDPSSEVGTSIGTAPIDVAAHLTILGKSLSTIGQRLAEHEGEITVSGMLSVLLDSTLCALGPLLCLTSETEELNGCPQPTLSKILDNISYFMPGL